ncbi:superinfection exclusion protein [Kordiimonas sp.]|uniref:superinfection exclusion protein n=1 Tax=Kordiimonas sp. TaxID=1970157 RepID=UPI003A9323C5
MKLRVWWIPQVPMKPFHVDVATVAEGVKMLEVLANYDQFQFDNRVKPDYTNVGGLEMFDPDDDTDSPSGSWVSWCDEESGEDDPALFIESVVDNNEASR